MFCIYLDFEEPSEYDMIEEMCRMYFDSLVVVNGRLTPFYEKMYIEENSVFDPVDRKWKILNP